MIGQEPQFWYNCRPITDTRSPLTPRVRFNIFFSPCPNEKIIAAKNKTEKNEQFVPACIQIRHLRTHPLKTSTGEDEKRKILDSRDKLSHLPQNCASGACNSHQGEIEVSLRLPRNGFHYPQKRKEKTNGIERKATLY